MPCSRTRCLVYSSVSCTVSRFLNDLRETMAKQKEHGCPSTVRISFSVRRCIGEICGLGVNKDGGGIYSRNSPPLPSNLAESARGFSKNRNFERLSPPDLLFRAEAPVRRDRSTEVPPSCAQKSFPTRHARVRGQSPRLARFAMKTRGAQGFDGDEGVLPTTNRDFEVTTHY